MTIRASYGISYDYVNGSMYVNSADSPPFGNTTIVTAANFSNPYAIQPRRAISSRIRAQLQRAVRSRRNLYRRASQHEDHHGASVELCRPTAVGQRLGGVGHLHGERIRASAGFLPDESGCYRCMPGQAPLLTTCNTTAQYKTPPLVSRLNNFPGNKYYADIDVMDTGGTSSYNGMILAIQKRLSKGLSTSANYTWSHCIGDLTWGNSTGQRGSGFVMPNNRRYDRSNCQSVEIGGTFSSDRRQLFNWTTVYETPKFSNRTTNLLASGWKISGIYRAQSAPSADGRADQRRIAHRRMRLARNGRITTGGNPLCANPSPTCWINPAAFSAPAAGTFGNLGRSNIPGPAFWQVDMALSRVFAVHEGYSWSSARKRSTCPTAAARAFRPQPAGGRLRRQPQLRNGAVRHHYQFA